MSGGHWNYQNDSLANEIFGWCCSPDYGQDGFKQAAIAKKYNPLEDKVLSEMLWDMLCVLHSYDWYACSDTCEETYRKDVDYFKKKWLKIPEKELARREIDAALEETRQELYKSLGVE
jgi:hypothetical protein